MSFEIGSKVYIDLAKIILAALINSLLRLSKFLLISKITQYPTNLLS